MVNLCILSAISLVIGVAGILTVTLIYTLTGHVVPFDNGVVVDAGSTHTEIILYKWLGDKEDGTGNVFQQDSCTVPGGLAENTNATAAASSLRECLTNISASIPAGEASTTSIFLGATAGFRLLNETNPDLSLEILEKVNLTFSEYGFNPEQVAIISGQQEGLYAWITANFLSNTLKSPPKDGTFGAMDLGGASTQIAFAVPEGDNQSAVHLRLYGFDQHVRAQSSLCFGVEKSYSRLLAELVADSGKTTEVIEEPCAPKYYNFTRTCEDLSVNKPCTKGLVIPACQRKEGDNLEFQFMGTGNRIACSDHVANMLNTSTCLKRGYDEEHCFQAVTAPTSQRFYAMSSFFYTVDFLNATGQSLKFFQNASKEICAMNESEVEQIPTSAPNNTVRQFCFQSVLIEHMLVNIYSFNDSTWGKIKFLRKLQKNDLGWALGYMIDATNSIPAEAPSEPAINLLGMILVLIICVALLAVGGFFFWKKRKTVSEVSYVQV